MLATEAGARAKVERLITLGGPTSGTLTVPRVLTGLDPLVQRMGGLASSAVAGRPESATRDDAVKVLASFPSLYQTLPPPDAPGAALAYQSETYARYRVAVPSAWLDAARQFHAQLARGAASGVEVIAIEGYGEPTPWDVADLAKLDQPAGYRMTPIGDGVVACRTSGASAGAPVLRTYYTRSPHGGLVVNSSVLAALDDLLATGATQRLEAALPQTSPMPEADDARPGDQDTQGDRFTNLARRLENREVLARRSAVPTKRRSTRGGDDRSAVVSRTRAGDATARVSPDQRAVEELLTGCFLGRDSSAPADRSVDGQGAWIPTIRVSLVNVGLESVHLLGDAGEAPAPADGPSSRRFLSAVRTCPVDAIAVGHYLGVLPQQAEAQLDRSISQALRTRTAARIARAGDPVMKPDPEMLLAQYVERGLLRGELGQPFFLPDPRPESGGGGAHERLIAIAGMGVAGRFGTPELTVLVRELCWSLGRMGKRHLATVLIGSGEGNIPRNEAVQAWMRGVEQALGGSGGKHPQLERITFVEIDPGRIADFDRALSDQIDRFAEVLRIDYVRMDEAAELAYFRDENRRRQQARWQAEALRDHDAEETGPTVPTRISVHFERDVLHLGAITSNASIPERQIPLKQWLVDEANGELASEADPAMQLERGQFLGRLLIKDDLRPQIFTCDPLVIMLDRTTARIHWEMVAQLDTDFTPNGVGLDDLPGGRARFHDDFFLGTARGLTRQLRTTFAPPPEPPPPPRRVLRVLVVADPAADAPLPGAIQEGAEVADLFESFNALPDRARGDNRVEVTRLLGPNQATATVVLREVMSRPYDVLHFAGHCYFDEKDPTASGWVFSGGRVISANLLNRIDRVPKFVFSNACESGVTPDRPEDYTVSLAPSFAEAFFQRGVVNFVCTAWPIDDLAARQFALRLYQGLLGLRSGPGRAVDVAPPQRMYQAMLEARLSIARKQDLSINPDGARTWGAYQHYGDPFFRFFQEAK
jgi:hypothetical protein